MNRVVCLTTTIIAVAVLTMTGCAAKNASSVNAGAGAAGADMAPLAQDYDNALPVLNQLVVGTFRLENTDHAVKAGQAADLLPLWRAYRGLSGGSSSSPVEMQALLKQIRGAMTEEQVASIAAMKLTRDDMMQLMQVRGLEMTNGANGAAGAASTATRQAERPAIGAASGGPGGLPGGGRSGGGAPPAGDPGMGGFPGGLPASGTPGAQQQGVGARGSAVPPPLYNALVELLQSKVY